MLRSRFYILGLVLLVLVGTASCFVVSGEENLEEYAPVEGKEYKVLWTYYQTAPIDEEPIMVDFYKEKFNVEFDVLDIDNKRYSEILNLKMASGIIPDFFRGGLDEFRNFVDQGLVADIPDGLLEKYAPNLLNSLNKKAPGWKKYCAIDGKLYALTATGNPIWSTPCIFRGDWLENVGIDKVPETLEEYEEAFYKFTNDDPDGNGKNDTYGLSSNGFTSIFGAFGFIPKEFGMPWHIYNWTERDGELVFSAIQPEMKEALTLLNKWYEDGVIDPEFVTGENQGGYWALSHAFINGRIGFSGRGLTYHWKPILREGGSEGPNRAELRKINPEAADKLIYAKPPLGPDGDRGVWSNNPIKNNKYMFGIGLKNESDKMGKILQVLDWVYSSQENYNIATNGIKNEMWEYKNVKAVWPPLEGKEYKAVQRKEEWKDMSKVNAQFGHTALQICHPAFDHQEQGINEDFSSIVGGDKYHMYNELLVSLPSMAKYKAELNKIAEEAYISIIAGDKPVDYFDEFVEKWRKAGGAQLEQEANDWYSTIN